MSFLNNLGQKISDVSQTTIKKTKDLADTAKLNLNISEEERKIDTAYEQIGKWYVQKHREDDKEDEKTWLDAIPVSESRIKECRESIPKMKGVAICQSCGASVDADAAFCSACGQKMPEKPKPEPVKEEDVEVIPPEQPSEEPASETVAENTSDGVIAPMLYTALGGPVLGFLYKAVNTMDSMVGYKNEKYLHFGRAAAKLDDVMNFLPARISALLMVGTAFISGKSYNGKQAWRIWRRDNRKHASPNSAQTESVCAGALGIQLAGDASYFGKVVKKPYIGDPTRAVEPEDIRRSHSLLYMTAVLALEVFEVVIVLECLWYFTVQV